LEPEKGSYAVTIATPKVAANSLLSRSPGALALRSLRRVPLFVPPASRLAMISPSVLHPILLISTLISVANPRAGSVTRNLAPGLGRHQLLSTPRNRLLTMKPSSARQMHRGTQADRSPLFPTVRSAALVSRKKDRIVPTKRPVVIVSTPFRTNRISTLRGVAPKAIRILISRVCVPTKLEITP